jgi:hypothetical protein
MMHLIEGQPWFDLEPYIDINALAVHQRDFALAIAANPSHVVSGIVGTQRNLHDQTHTELGDFAKARINQSSDDADAFARLGSMARFYTYCKYMYPLTGLAQCLHIRTIKNDSYPRKHLSDSCVDTPLASSFDFLFSWLDSQDIFSQYGRVIMFLNEPGTMSTLHRDNPFHVSPKNQFIWISLGNEKRFFVLEDDVRRHYITSRCAIFDNTNYHGSNPCQHASWSLRIDGVFSASMLQRTGLDQHFKS